MTVPSIPDRLDAVAAWLGVEAVGASRLGTGHSHEMWVVEVVDGDDVVLRVEQPGMFGTDVVEEAGWLRRLAGCGVPVPEVLAVDAVGAVVGRRMVATRFIPAPHRESRSGPDRDTPVTDLVRRVHELHQLDAEATGLPAGGVDRWLTVARTIAREPLLEEAAHWLRTRRPVGARDDVPVHGDVGPGNLVHDGSRVLAFTDWEFAHLGDPGEDWVFLASVRGRSVMSEDAWRERIAAEVGWTATDDEWRYWKATNAFTGACANLTALALFESGTAPSPEMLAVGTALHHHFLAIVADIVGT